MNETEEFILEHFGIKGMKWGVRKEPSNEVKVKREAKAQKYVKKADKIQTKLDKLGPYSFRAKELREEQKTALDDAERKRQGKLSKKQKQVAVGAGVAVAIVAAYGTYQTINSGNGRRLVEKGKLHVTRNAVPWRQKPELADPNLDVDGIMSKVVSHINPNYGKPGTKMNCRRATYAYEMRRRGYDVAATRTTNGRGQDVTGAFNALHPGVNLVPPGQTGIFARVFGERNKAYKPFTDEITNTSLFGRIKLASPGDLVPNLLKEPDGARGEVGIQWRGGGGHSLSWEKIKGKIVVFDNQTGKKYEDTDIYGLLKDVSDAGYTRLDDKPLNTDFLMRWLKSA